MPISPAKLARRHAEQGRIRLGHKGPKGNPVKLTTFRFTSPNEQHVRALADLYGGEARPWDNGGAPEWEVITDAKSIPVIVLKGAVSQWMETWSGGGCLHRCDGEVQQLPTPGAKCSPDDRAHDDAKPTTRVAVMLPELASIGAWRLESHGWNAAAEIPAIGELAAYVGDLVPARLHLVARKSVSNGQTKRYVVPVIDLEVSAPRLREIAATASGMGALGSSTPPQIGGPAPRELGTRPAAEADYGPWLREVYAATSRAGLSTIWQRMVAEELLGAHAPVSDDASGFVEAWKARSRELPDVDPAPDADGPVLDADGIVDAEVVEDGDARSSDEVWATVILPLGGELGMSTADLDDGFAAWPPSGGRLSSDATAAELLAYAEFLRNA